MRAVWVQTVRLAGRWLKMLEETWWARRLPETRRVSVDRASAIRSGCARSRSTVGTRSIPEEHDGFIEQGMAGPAASQVPAWRRRPFRGVLRDRSAGAGLPGCRVPGSASGSWFQAPPSESAARVPDPEPRTWNPATRNRNPKKVWRPARAAVTAPGGGGTPDTEPSAVSSQLRAES